VTQSRPSSDSPTMDGNAPLKALFVGGAGIRQASKALRILDSYALETEAYFGNWGDPLPHGVNLWTGDVIVSFLSRWILPKSVLENASICAINFHPGPPEYPGYLCYTSAILNCEKTYGTTAHHMTRTVDSGSIINANIFAIPGDIDILQLKEIARDKLVDNLSLVCSKLFDEGVLPDSTHTWGKKTLTLNEFETFRSAVTDQTTRERLRRSWREP
jgi:hypothetical protein